MPQPSSRRVCHLGFLFACLGSTGSLVSGQTPATQFGELLRAPILPATPFATSALVTGDVDRDGDTDVVFADNAGHCRLHLNNGGLSFTDATASHIPPSPAGTSTSALAMGDVDGDGDLDLILGKTAIPSRLFLNDGTGRFTDATTGRMPATTWLVVALALGDVDRDGDLDLVLGDGVTCIPCPGQQNRLYLNNGFGLFADATSTHLPVDTDVTIAVTLGDVDGDGDLDLALGNRRKAWNGSAYVGGQSRLYRNDGTGHFTDVTAAQMPARDDEDTRVVVLADVDGDRDLDMVLGNLAEASPFPQSRLYINDGAGRFTDVTATQFPSLRASTLAIAAADVDNDGDVDLMLSARATNPGEHPRLYLNDGAGRFTQAGEPQMPSGIHMSVHPACMALTDMDRDGDPDLVIGMTTGNPMSAPRLYPNDGRGGFSDVQRPRIPRYTGGAKALAVADVDRDGDLDLVMAAPNRLCLNDGRGAFQDATAQMASVTASTAAVVAGDVDGDGAPDLVLANSPYFVNHVGWVGGPETLLLNDGTGGFTDATAGRLASPADKSVAAALVDVDRDLDLDLVTVNLGEPNRLYLNDGTGRFTDVTATHLPAGAYLDHAVAAGDLDGDGDFDLVLGASGQDRLLLNDGSGHFADATLGRLPAVLDETWSLVAFDADGDGDLDLAAGNLLQQNRLYLNTGGGAFVDATAARMPVDTDATVALAAGDVDLDGDLDLLCGNNLFGQGATQLYLNDGTGGFALPSIPRLPASSLTVTEGLVLVDVDRDGDLDILFSYAEQLLINRHRQIHAPATAARGTTWALELYSSPGYATAPHVVMPLVSLVELRPPVPAPPFGLLGLNPTALIVLPAVVVDPARGLAVATLAIPNSPALGGLPLLAQGVIIPSGDPAQVRLTNILGEPIQ